MWPFLLEAVESEEREQEQEEGGWGGWVELPTAAQSTAPAEDEEEGELAAGDGDNDDDDDAEADIPLEGPLCRTPRAARLSTECGIAATREKGSKLICDYLWSGKGLVRYKAL